MPDKYRSFTELARAETEGVAFEVLTKDQSPATCIVAPHGGNIEPATSELALAIAGVEFSCYTLVGLKPEQNSGLHVTSTRFDDPRCIDLIARAARVITLHGEGSNEAVIYFGGRDTRLKEQLEQSLQAHDFSVAEHSNPLLQGTSARNICNKGATGAGVQLELGRGLRAAMFESLDERGRCNPTPVFAAFVACVRDTLLAAT